MRESFSPEEEIEVVLGSEQRSACKLEDQKCISGRGCAAKQPTPIVCFWLRKQCGPFRQIGRNIKDLMKGSRHLEANSSLAEAILMNRIRKISTLEIHWTRRAVRAAYAPSFRQRNETFGAY
jgi:hypothetical protein